MIKNLREFIGVQRKMVTSVDKKVDLIIREIFDSMEKVLSIDLKGYDNIQQLIAEKGNVNDEQSYFWDWLDENGLSKLDRILRSNLPDLEELHDLLDYREMILQLDIESQILDSYFISIADTLTSIDDYIQMGSEQAAAEESPYSDTTYETIEYHVSGSEHNRKQRWIVNHNKSPAEKKQDFCYTV